jgi:hypothetical protein
LTAISQFLQKTQKGFESTTKHQEFTPEIKAPSKLSSKKGSPTNEHIKKLEFDNLDDFISKSDKEIPISTESSILCPQY